MKVKAALQFYKTKAAMRRAAGVSKQAITQWFKRADGNVPFVSAYRLTADTDGKLPLHPEHYGK